MSGQAPGRGGVSATATTSIEIHAARLDGSALVRDYLAGAPQLAPFYAGHPFDAQAYRRKADAVERRLSAAERARIAPALRPLSENAATKLNRILDGDGFVVTTGQQAGLFGGPLYTVHKALSAVRLAAALETLLEKPVLAVFWIAADDHDWDEVDHAWLVDRVGALRRIAVVQDSDMPPHAMADRLLGEGVLDALDVLDATLPETEFTPALRDAIRAAYRPDESVARAFEELLAHIFRDFDLALMSSAHAAVRAAGAPVLSRDLENASAHAAAIARQSERLDEAGYAVQVPVALDASNVFLHDEHGRDRIMREGDAWALRRSRRQIGASEMASMLQSAPSHFSPNVFLRPVVESSVLPTLAYVGGPAELAYFAQIGCLFHAHGIEPPLVYPRFRIRLIEARVRRVLEKFGLDVSDFDRPLHELKAALVRDELPSEVTGADAMLRRSIEEGYARMSEAATTIDPTLEGWLTKQRNAALNGVADATRKVAAHLRKRWKIELAQIERAAAGLMPEGSHQERVLNVLPFLARYGPDLPRDMLAALDVGFEASAPAWAGVRCDG